MHKRHDIYNGAAKKDSQRSKKRKRSPPSILDDYIPSAWSAVGPVVAQAEPIFWHVDAPPAEAPALLQIADAKETAAAPEPIENVVGIKPDGIVEWGKNIKVLDTKGTPLPVTFPPNPSTLVEKPHTQVREELGLTAARAVVAPSRKEKWTAAKQVSATLGGTLGLTAAHSAITSIAKEIGVAAGFGGGAAANFGWARLWGAIPRAQGGYGMDQGHLMAAAASGLTGIVSAYLTAKGVGEAEDFFDDLKHHLVTKHTTHEDKLLPYTPSETPRWLPARQGHERAPLSRESWKVNTIMHKLWLHASTWRNSEPIPYSTIERMSRDPHDLEWRERPGEGYAIKNHYVSTTYGAFWKTSNFDKIDEWTNIQHKIKAYTIVGVGSWTELADAAVASQTPGAYEAAPAFIREAWPVYQAIIKAHNAGWTIWIIGQSLGGLWAEKLTRHLGPHWHKGLAINPAVDAESFNSYSPDFLRVVRQGDFIGELANAKKLPDAVVVESEIGLPPWLTPGYHHGAAGIRLPKEFPRERGDYEKRAGGIFNTLDEIT